MPTPRRTILGVPPGQAEEAEAAPAVPAESQRPGSDSVPPGAAEMAELIQGIGAHLEQLKPVITRLSSSLPPPPRVPSPVSREPSAGPAELDKGAQALLTEAIAQAIAQQLGKVRISSIPPSAPTSSIRAAAHVGGKVGKWSMYVSGGVSLLGSLIAIWRPEYAAPLSQSVKLILALVQAWLGSVPPPPAQAPARDVPVLVAPAPAPAP